LIFVCCKFGEMIDIPGTGSPKNFAKQILDWMYPPCNRLD
jgi:hypothetical protein